MPSFQVGDACYPNQKAAALAWSVDVPLSPLTIGASCTGIVRPVIGGTDSAPTVAWTWTRLSGTCAVPATVNSTYTATPCGLLDVEDVQPIAWGIALAWIAVYAVSRFIRRAVAV